MVYRILAFAEDFIYVRFIPFVSEAYTVNLRRMKLSKSEVKASENDKWASNG